VDPWQQSIAGIETDFATLMGSFTQLVTVTQIDPDTDTNTTAAGVTLGSAANVSALQRVRGRKPLNVSGGELGRDECRFVFAVSAIEWTPKARDQITDAAGIVWQIESVQLIAFGNLVACDVVVKR
jgi:hypothetical protein